MVFPFKNMAFSFKNMVLSRFYKCIICVRPKSLPFSMMAMKPAQCAKRSTSLLGGIATATYIKPIYEHFKQFL